MLYTLKLRRSGRRLLPTIAGLAVLFVVCGGVVMLLRSGGGSDGPYYTPGVTPSREECVLAKMKTYAKVTKQTLTNIAEECELTVQSIEGHEKLRRAWEAREAARPPEPLPAAEPAKAQPEGDKLRRVWN
ncbi:hypothetical protein [Ferrovibrio xuzhouensis]|uniref:Conjugative transfer region protein TrbK n=1 Tax=Ferrovibrio xuzhouensis TaxID=1576914 RepID=A0ABV7VBH8_9PROT